MSSPVAQVVDLADQWPCIDPFLFCVHHVDQYPAANPSMGPDASLAGRSIGSDFEGLDGWRMYHGSTIPGFPQHPHRGFETITYARQGFIDHADSLGASARFGRGDVQWMTAGSGVVHSEMFPLFDADGPNPLELFQIWINLPAEDKMVDPHFSMLWDRDIPRISVTDNANKITKITVIAGSLQDRTPASPPPHSWASRADADVAIWHVSMEAGAQYELPAAGPETVRAVYVFSGDTLQVADTNVRNRQAAVCAAGVPLALTAGSEPTEVLVLQGRPIGEPVARYGPFVMNTEAEIEATFADYRQTQFGGWPWPKPDPTHGGEATRFAQHSSGNVETPDVESSPST